MYRTGSLIRSSTLLWLLLYHPNTALMTSSSQSKHAGAAHKAVVTTSNMKLAKAAAAAAAAGDDRSSNSSKDINTLIPETNNRPTDAVIVVGAGFAGLAMSLGLARLGCKVLLVEKRPSFEFRAGATLGLSPNGIQALEELFDDGIRSKIMSIGRPIRYGDDGNDNKYDWQGRMLLWWALRDELLERVRQSKHPSLIQIYNGYSLQSISDDPKSSVVKATFTNIEDADDRLVLEGAFLIGADGVNSVTRGLLDKSRADAIDTGITVWRGTVEVDTTKKFGPDRVLSSLYLEKGASPMPWFVGQSSFFGIFNHGTPATPGIMTWVVSSKDDVPDSNGHPRTVLEKNNDVYGLLDENVQATIQAIFALAKPSDLSRPIRMKVVKPYKDVNATTTAKQQPQRWGGRGRCTLIGDAAHALRPVQGLGSSTAFEDCVVLQRTLNKFYNDRGGSTASEKGETILNSIGSCLKEFEEQRFARVKRIWDHEWESAQSAYHNKKPASGLTPEFRDWVFKGV